MTAEFKTLDQLLQDGSLYQIAADAKKPFTGLFDSVDKITLSIQSLNSDLLIIQTIIGVIALIVIGITFLPFGATAASIKTCQVDMNQKLLKTGGVLIVVMTSLSAIMFVEVLKLSQILNKL